MSIDNHALDIYDGLKPKRKFIAERAGISERNLVRWIKRFVDPNPLPIPKETLSCNLVHFMYALLKNLGENLYSVSLGIDPEEPGRVCEVLGASVRLEGVAMSLGEGLYVISPQGGHPFNQSCLAHMVDEKTFTGFTDRDGTSDLLFATFGGSMKLAIDRAYELAVNKVPPVAHNYLY